MRSELIFLATLTLAGCQVAPQPPSRTVATDPIPPSTQSAIDILSKPTLAVLKNQYPNNLISSESVFAPIPKAFLDTAMEVHTKKFGPAYPAPKTIELNIILQGNKMVDNYITITENDESISFIHLDIPSSNDLGGSIRFATNPDNRILTNIQQFFIPKLPGEEAKPDILVTAGERIKNEVVLIDAIMLKPGSASRLLEIQTKKGPGALRDEAIFESNGLRLLFPWGKGSYRQLPISTIKGQSISVPTDPPLYQEIITSPQRGG